MGPWPWRVSVPSVPGALLRHLRWRLALAALATLGAGVAIFAISPGAHAREGAIVFLVLGGLWAIAAGAGFAQRSTSSIEAPAKQSHPLDHPRVAPSDAPHRTVALRTTKHGTWTMAFTASLIGVVIPVGAIVKGLEALRTDDWTGWILIAVGLAVLSFVLSRTLTFAMARVLIRDNDVDVITFDGRLRRRRESFGWSDVDSISVVPFRSPSQLSSQRWVPKVVLQSGESVILEPLFGDFVTRAKVPSDAMIQQLRWAFHVDPIIEGSDRLGTAGEFP